MRLLRAVLVLIATLLALAVLAAWQAPRYLDWNRYRDDISRIAAGILDRPVLIEGPVSLRLLPHPVLTAADVRVGGEPDQGSFSARELSLRIGIAPLLGGNVEARELLLRGADLRLPWPLPEDALRLRRPRWLGAIAVRIENGRVVIGKVAIGAINATITGGGSLGDYRVSGTARLYGQTWHAASHLGPTGADYAFPLDLTLDGEGPISGTQVTLTGQVSPDGAGGRVTARGSDLGRLMPAPNLPFSATGRLTVAAGLAAADDLALTLGGALAHGALSLRISPSFRVDLALAATRLDLDPWVPVLLQQRNTSYPMGLDLSAEAAQLAGGLLRRLRAALELLPAQVEIREANTILPGEASLRLAGQIVPGAGGGTVANASAAPRFEGKVALAAPDLRTTLTWLDPSGEALNALPSGVLRSLDASAQASLGADRLAITGISGTLDGSRLDGSATLGLGLFRGQASSPLRADLQVDRVNLDPWLPAEPPSLSDLGARLRRSDVDLRLQAAAAALRGAAISGLMLDAAVRDGRLSIRRFEARALGVEVNASGSIEASGRVSHARVVFDAPDASPIGAWVSAFWQAPEFWRAPLLAWVEADGQAQALDIAARLRLGGSDFGMNAELALPASGSARVSLNNPAAPALLRSAGFQGLAAAFGEGPLAIAARLAVAPDHVAAEGIEVTAGSLRAGGHLSIERTGAEPRVVGELAAEELPLPPIHWHSPDPFPLGVLHGWQGRVHVRADRAQGAAAMLHDVSGTLTLDRDKLRVDDFRGTLRDGSFSGAASLDASSEPPLLTLSGKLSGAVLGNGLTGWPLDIIGGRAGGDVALSASGHSPAAMLATLDGRIHCALDNGILTGIDLAALDQALRSGTGPGAPDTALNAALSGGQTAYADFALAGIVKRGILDVGGSAVHGAAGSIVWSGGIDLPDSALDLRAVVRPALPEAPEIGLRITGPADAPRYSVDLADVIRWRVQHASAPAPVSQ